MSDDLFCRARAPLRLRVAAINFKKVLLLNVFLRGSAFTSPYIFEEGVYETPGAQSPRAYVFFSSFSRYTSLRRFLRSLSPPLWSMVPHARSYAIYFPDYFCPRSGLLFIFQDPSDLPS